MRRGPDAATLLDRALGRSASSAGLVIAIVESSATRWASATFTGARHRIVVTGPDAAGGATWLDALPETEFDLSRHLVADLVVAQRRLDGDGFTATIEALTVEDR